MRYSLLKHAMRCAIFSLLIGAVSCTYDGDEIVVPEVPQNSIEMNLCAQISQQYVTRVNDTGFADGDKIGVFVAFYDGEEAPELTLRDNYANNVRFVYNYEDDSWTGAYQFYWKNNYTPIDAYGYYPYDQDLSSVLEYPFTVKRQQNITVPNTNMYGYEASDFLWAKAERVLPTEGYVALQHKHIMAGVQITLVEGIGFEPGEWNNISKVVQINNTYLSSNINLQSGVVSVDDSTSPEAITPIYSSGDYRAIVVPQSVDAGKTLISVNIDGQAYSFSRDDVMVYAPNKLHKFTLEVVKRMPEGDYELSLIAESISPWQNDQLSHNGEAREYVTVHVERDEYIGDVVARMGIDPKEIVNLKLTGTLSRHDHFRYIRENMPYLEAVNLKELRTIDQTSYRWEGGWGPLPYDQPLSADDYIPMGAFQQMRYLSYVVWPDHLVGIGNAAFLGCSLRGSLIFPEGLKHLGSDVFEAYNNQNSSLTGSIYLPMSLEYIGGGIFNPADGQKCNLTGEFILPPNIKFIGGAAFGACPYMTGRLHIPESLQALESGAFPPNLTGDVTIPAHIKRVGELPKKITSVHIPEGVEELAPWALAGNHMMRGDVHLPSTINKLGNEVFADSYVAHVTLPEGLNIIPWATFDRCIYLRDTMKIPSTVQYIEGYAFCNCQRLSAVVLPKDLQRIDQHAFENCRSLEMVECKAIEPPQLDGSAFNGVDKSSVALVVPEEAIDAYKNAENWREFKRISAYRNFVCRPMQAGLLNKGSTRDVVLNSDGYWEVTYCPDWASVDIQSGYKKTQLKVTIEDLPHGAGVREDKIIFTLTDKQDENGEPITCTYDIVQYDYEKDEDSEYVLQQATKGNNGGINITIVGDGYSAKDIYDGSYEADVIEGMEYFFGIEPYKTYREYFNINIDFALSYDSGVCSDVNIWRTTKFNSTYGAGAGGRLRVDEDAVVSYILNDVDGKITPENINQSLIICLMNSDAYEGVTSLWTTGAAVAFMPHCRGDYPNDYRGLMQHEACGHGFGKLADEYIYHNEYIQKCKCVCCGHVADVESAKAYGWYRNISLSGKYSTVEWRHLIFHENYDDIVDIYEGAFFHARGVYRAEVNSCMNNNIPYFNSISRQAIVERIKDYAGESFSFEEFVANDSREIGEFTRSSSADEASEVVIHNPSPKIIKGSVLDNIKTE